MLITGSLEKKYAVDYRMWNVLHPTLLDLRDTKLFVTRAASFWLDGLVEDFQLFV
jgi:hypothetical protein